jgi:hypothetical protein
MEHSVHGDCEVAHGDVVIVQVLLNSLNFKHDGYVIFWFNVFLVFLKVHHSCIDGLFKDISTVNYGGISKNDAEFARILLEDSLDCVVDGQGLIL